MEWQTIRRETGLIEHTINGIGHPNPASACRIAWHNINSPLYSREPSEKNYQSEANAWTIHGCNGDCSRDDFPGEMVNNLIYAYNLYKNAEKLSYLFEIDEEISYSLYELEMAFDQYIDEVLDNLVFYLGEQSDEWRLNYMTKAEFMFWPLEALRVFGV
jgi:hypothetical protein